MVYRTYNDSNLGGRHLSQGTTQPKRAGDYGNRCRPLRRESPDFLHLVGQLLGEVRHQPEVGDGRERVGLTRERDHLVPRHELRAEDGLLALLVRDRVDLEREASIRLLTEQAPGNLEVEERDRTVPFLALRGEEGAVHVDGLAGQRLRDEQVGVADLLVQFPEGGVTDILARTGEPTDDVEDVLVGVDERTGLHYTTDVEAAPRVTRPHDGDCAAAADAPGLRVAEVVVAHGGLPPEERDVALVVDDCKARHLERHHLAVAEVGEDPPLVVGALADRLRELDLVVGHGRIFLFGLDVTTAYLITMRALHVLSEDVSCCSFSCRQMFVYIKR